MESQQETSHDILESLLQELVEREEDFRFYISLCLRLLARSQSMVGMLGLLCGV